MTATKPPEPGKLTMARRMQRRLAAPDVLLHTVFPLNPIRLMIGLGIDVGGALILVLHGTPFG